MIIIFFPITKKLLKLTVKDLILYNYVKYLYQICDYPINKKKEFFVNRFRNKPIVVARNDEIIATKLHFIAHVMCNLQFTLIC